MRKRKRKQEKGNRYGDLIVLEDLPSEAGISGKYSGKVKCWCLLCDRKDFICSIRDLRSGNTRSSGCKESFKAYFGGENNPNYKHGYSNGKHPAYERWCLMTKRCRPGHADSPRYHDRGIRVEEPWLSDAASYCNWVSLHCGGDYTLSVDRIDNDGNYSPANCRIATSKEQANNKSDNLIFVAFGKVGTLTGLVEEFSKPLGIKYSTVWARIKTSGWGVELALVTPADPGLNRSVNSK